MHIIECQNEEAPLSFIALASLKTLRPTSSNVASLLPRAPLHLRSPSKCLSGPLLYVVLWPPPDSPLSYNVVLLGSDFILKVSYVPLSSPFLFINNYKIGRASCRERV